MLTIVIPMAGHGQRFKDKGYTFPKPLIDVDGAPMVQRVIETLPRADRYVFIVLREHGIEVCLMRMVDSATVHVRESVAPGAALSVLGAEHLIEGADEILLANCDQLVAFDETNFRVLLDEAKPDGVIFTFHSTHPKWSYVGLDERNHVTRVVEKVPISDVATCGIYYWRTGALMLDALQKHVDSGDTLNGESYIAPSYNVMIREGRKVLPFFVSAMQGLGTPEDLERYLARG